MRIGLVLNILNEEYQISIYKSVKKKAEELGLELVCFQLENINFSSLSFASHFPAESFFNIDGILFVTSVIVDGYKINLKAEVERLWGKIPVVSIGQEVKGLPSLLIQSDASMKQLVEHLILEHGYRNFLYISGSENHHDADMREDIFKKTIEVYKPWYPELNYFVRRGWFSEHVASIALADFYAENPDAKIDAIVCASDNMAIGSYKFFQMNQNNQIKECAVTGFDDIPQSAYVIPSLTTVHQPLSEIGEKAVTTLFKLLNHEKVPKKSFVESTLIIRNSCGCKINTDEIQRDQNYLVEMQNKYIQSEQFLRLVSHFAQDINYCEDVRSFKNVIDTYVEQLGIQNFCVLSFPIIINEASPFDFHDFIINPLYIKRNGRVFYEFNGNQPMTIANFFNKYRDYDAETPDNLIFKFLNMGNSFSGLIFYDANDQLLPYLCTISISITQAIERINSFELNKRRSEFLESEINKRTRELVEANNKRMEVEGEVLRISEIERQRFSTDLHDDICQRLAGISMLCRSYSKNEEGAKKEEMEELAQLISQTLQTTRQYAHNSYPVELESLGLNKSINNLCNSFENTTGINCKYEFKIKNDADLNNVQKLNIFRIVQEALHNVAKHSKAQNACVSIVENSQNICINITDDGIGINSTRKNKAGLGLNSMQYRANQIGATFKIRPNKTGGTCVEVRI
ncbi:MAG: substrate-binding domain-containing protein [Treponema sp.]|nr:substrate-binding domain-containing protein [Treponema sp.]